MAELEETLIGRSPHAVLENGNRQTQGPFAYASSEAPRSGSIGAGFLSGPIGPNGEARGDALAAQAHYGQWTGEDGSTNFGAAADAGVARVGIESGGVMGPLGIDGELLTANAGISANESTSTVGAGANLVGIGGSLGTDERSLRVGAALGVGVSGRAHYGDADGDGNPEYGIGMDLGPFSVDVKDEKFGYMWEDTKWAAGAVANGAGAAWDSVTSW